MVWPLFSHLALSPSRKAMDSNSTRTASSIGITGRASKTNAGSIEQNLWTAVGSSQSKSIYPPQSPTRITNNSILKLAGALHWVKTSRIRFWAFSYSIGDPCGRSVQVSMYFIAVLILLGSFCRNRSADKYNENTISYGWGGGKSVVCLSRRSVSEGRWFRSHVVPCRVRQLAVGFIDCQAY